MTAKIPESHRDLLAGPVNVVLITLMPDGQPQSTPIWCSLDGDDILINNQPLHNIEVRRRVVDMTEEGALEHLNALNVLYGCGPGFFGDAVDADLRHKFTPVKIRIQPVKVRVEG